MQLQLESLQTAGTTAATTAAAAPAVPTPTPPRTQEYLLSPRNAARVARPAEEVEEIAAKKKLKKGNGIPQGSGKVGKPNKPAAHQTNGRLCNIDERCYIAAAWQTFAKLPSLPWTVDSQDAPFEKTAPWELG